MSTTNFIFYILPFLRRYILLCSLSIHIVVISDKMLTYKIVIITNLHPIIVYTLILTKKYVLNVRPIQACGTPLVDCQAHTVLRYTFSRMLGPYRPAVHVLQNVIGQYRPAVILQQYGKHSGLRYTFSRTVGTYSPAVHLYSSRMLGTYSHRPAVHI